MQTFEAIQSELEKMPPAVRSCGLAASALTLAYRLDEASSRDTAPIARELRATLAELRALASKVPAEVDPLDELERKRAARRPKAAASKRAAGGGRVGAGGRRAGGKRGSDPGSGAG